MFGSEPVAYATGSEPPKITCATLFEYLASQMPDSGFTTSALDVFQNHKKSVRFVESLIDQHGDTFWVYQKKEEANAWGSSYKNNRFDPQGDPRWFLEVLGDDAAQVWGFYRNGKDLAQVPSPETWIKKVKMVSASLEQMGHEGIAIGYHPNLHVDERTQTTSVTTYLKRFINLGEIPVAPKGTPFLHDISFHSGAILLEKRFLDIARRRVDYFWSASKYFKRLAKQAESQEPIRASIYLRMANMLKDSVVEMVDLGTGLINPLLADYASGSRYKGEATQASDIAYNVHAHFIGLEGKSQIQNLRAALVVEQRKIEDFPDLVSVKDLLEEVEVFDFGYKSPFVDFDSRKPLNISIEELCLSLAERRALLREVSLSLSNEYGPTALQMQHAEASRLAQPQRWWSRLFFSR
jgi:hypothetical protein